MRSQNVDQKIKTEQHYKYFVKVNFSEVLIMIIGLYLFAIKQMYIMLSSLFEPRFFDTIFIQFTEITVSGDNVNFVLNKTCIVY